jgi:catechol 2,3-dioxygenase-like lactoylglutathione lyase family enzyme
VRVAGQPESLILVLIETGRKRTAGYMDHWGFHVPARADVDAIADRARAAGILAKEPTYAGPVVGYYCIIHDPDGNELEFSCDQLKA